MRYLALMLDVVGLKHTGRHGEQRDCDQPADLLSVQESSCCP